MGKKPCHRRARKYPVTYQEVKSQFGFLEAVDELGLTWGSRSKGQHALCGGWWRERHLNQSIPFPVQDTVICWHTEGTVRKVLRLELLEIKGARKLKVFPCVGGFVCATRGPQTSGTFPAGVAAVGSMAVLGCELRAPPNLYPGLPVCCSLTCWPFLLVLLPFLPLVELFECLCSLLKPGDKHFNVIQGAVQDLL